MSIWRFYIGDFIRIIDINNHQHTGVIICMLGAEEVDEKEDFISIETEDGQIGFYAHDIKSIEYAKEIAAVV